MLDDVETHRSTRATADRSGAVYETVTRNVQTLAGVREDEAVVLRLVEPEHRSVHSCARRLNMHARRRPTGITIGVRRRE